MLKKLLSLIVAIALIFFAVPMVQAASKPTLKVSSCEAKQGETITLSVSIENNPGINTFSFGFDYDVSKLKLLDVTVNDNLGGQFTYKSKAVWFNSKDTKYNGEILELKFKVLNSGKIGKADVRVTYSPGDISNAKEKDVNFNIVAGTVVISEQKITVSFFTKVMDFFQKILSLLKNLFN